MKSNFDICFERVISSEGGYVDHPLDTGGATNLGCTQNVWEMYVGHEVTKDDIKALTKKDVKPLYKARYWDAIHGDELPAGLDYAMFDAAINSGCTRASKWIQEIVGVSADGAIGNNTILAISNFKNVATLINEYMDKRLTFLQRLKTWPVFGRGWEARVKEVRNRSLDMV